MKYAIFLHFFNFKSINFVVNKITKKKQHWFIFAPDVVPFLYVRKFWCLVNWSTRCINFHIARNKHRTISTNSIHKLIFGGMSWSSFGYVMLNDLWSQSEANAKVAYNFSSPIVFSSFFSSYFFFGKLYPSFLRQI